MKNGFESIDFREAFRGAEWVVSEGVNFPLYKRVFSVFGEVKRATVRIIGLGAFVFYVNGKQGTDDVLLPLSTDFHKREDYPKDEELGHRIYISEYDISGLLREGENSFSVLLGNGWYREYYNETDYGELKLVYSIELEDEKGKRLINSGREDAYRASFVTESRMFGRETHDFTDFDLSLIADTEIGEDFAEAAVTEPVETNYYFTDCPRDRVIEKIVPTLIRKEGKRRIYDIGCNTSAYPVLSFDEGSAGCAITVSEELDGNGELDSRHSHGQIFKVVTGGKSLSTHMLFTWLGFRYMAVEGDGRVESVHRVHTDIKKTSYFTSSDKTLNWIYDAYINTQSSNMHGGIPSDCPHIERRGYTGDGQLVLRAAMRCFDAYEFYKKWVMDIKDCQDGISGHVQYTAPYVRSGGGPGGWGAAIVIVPYEMWRYYGDDSFIRDMYPNMLKYFEYLEAHSENELVISDKEGEWCLGEWCTPDPVILSAAFVNNYFYIKALSKVIEIAEYLGKRDDIPKLYKKMELRKRATGAAFINSHDSNFFGARQGANAFALDAGLGSERTKRQFIDYYRRLGYYDTGIFGTDIVTRLLFEYGEGELAYGLLVADEPHGFGRWMKEGATTFREYWGTSRSHSHPMFGAVVAYLFEYILGIRYDAAKDEPLRIEPVRIASLGEASGYVTLPIGRVSAAIKRDGERVALAVGLPEGVSCAVRLEDGSETIQREKEKTYIIYVKEQKNEF